MKLNLIIKKQINKQIQKKFSKNYFDSIPLTQIFELLNSRDIIAIQEDGTLWSGFLCGNKGNVSIELKTNNEIINNAMLILQWYKMESGRYEINTYIS